MNSPSHLTFSWHPLRLSVTFMVCLALISAHMVLSGAWLSDSPFNPVAEISDRYGYLLIITLWLSYFIILLAYPLWLIRSYKPLCEVVLSSRRLVRNVLGFAIIGATLLTGVGWAIFFLKAFPPHGTVSGAEIGLNGVISRKSASRDWGNNAFLNLLLVILPITTVTFPQFFLRRLSSEKDPKNLVDTLPDAAIRNIALLVTVVIIGNLLLMSSLGVLLDPDDSFYIRFLIYLIEGLTLSLIIISRRDAISDGIEKHTNRIAQWVLGNL